MADVLGGRSSGPLDTTAPYNARVNGSPRQRAPRPRPFLHILLPALLATAACGGREPGPPAGGVSGGGSGGPGTADPEGRARVVLFGIDGADWRVIDPLMAAGRMPNMSRVVREGAAGTLLSMEPSASPSLWTTIATGVSPERHGIHGFVVPAAQSAPVRPVTSAMRQAPAFWNILSRYDRKSGVVGWLVTWPAEPVDGFIVSSYLPYVYNWSTGRPLKGTIVEGIPHQTFPEGLIDEIEALKVRPESLDRPTLERFYDPVAAERLSAEDRECVTGFRWSLACDETYRRIGRHLFARYPVDLFAVYFGGADVASHRFWKFAHPEALDYRVRPEDAAVLGRVIDAYYEHLDAALGEYLADLGPGDTLVVLSDHGFQPVWDPSRPTTSGHHRLEGVIALWGRGVVPGARIEGARLVDVLPTLLLLLEVPRARTLEGQPMTAALDPGFVSRHPQQVVADYGPASAAEGPGTSDFDDNVLERLRSLGYIQ